MAPSIVDESQCSDLRDRHYSVSSREEFAVTTRDVFDTTLQHTNLWLEKSSWKTWQSSVTMHTRCWLQPCMLCAIGSDGRTQCILARSYPC